MNHADEIAHWRKEADGYLESAAVLFRKQRFRQTLQHCYFAVQSAIKGSLAKSAMAAPNTVSLVVMGDALGREWSESERELLVTLTACARGSVDENEQSDAMKLTKEECLRTLTQTARIIADLRCQ